MKVSAILDAIDLRSYALPEFQRGYVWGRDDVRQLMTSLYRRYPVGSLLVWETPVETTRLRDEDASGAGSVVKLILDGQQRITSLYGVVRGEAPPFFQGKRDAFTDLYFDLRTEVFEFYGPVKMRDDPLWANVTEVHTTGLQPWFGRLADVAEGDRNLYLERINRIAQITEIDLHVEEITGSNRSLDEVVDIFNRVNSGGTKLSKGDLALARICAQAPDAREMLTSHLDRWNATGQQFTLDWLMRVVNALVTGQAAFTALRDVPAAEFTGQIDRAAEIVDQILDAIDTHLGLDPDRSLPAPNALPVMARHVAEVGWPLPPEDLNRLLWWYVHAFNWGRFSASTETALQQDLEALRGGGMEGLIAGMSRWRGSLELKPDDFVGAGRGSRLYPMLRLVCCGPQPADSPELGTGASSGVTAGTASMHHIFAKSALHDAGHDTQQRNAIANLCFLDRTVGRTFDKRLPDDYLAGIDSDPALRQLAESQWIPTDPSLWTLDRYDDFLAARRELLADAANRFLDALLHGRLAEPADRAGTSGTGDDAHRSPEAGDSPSGAAGPDAGIPGAADRSGESGEPRDDADQDPMQVIRRALELLGLAHPELDAEITGEHGEILAFADALWPEGLQSGRGEPVALLLEADPEMERRLNQLGYRYFVGVADLLDHLRDDYDAAGDVLPLPAEGATPTASAGGSSTVASPKQTAALERFRSWTHSDAATALVRQVVRILELDPSDLGRTWGATLFPNEGVALRLNAGIRELLIIRSDGTVRVPLLGERTALANVPAGSEFTDAFKGLDGAYAVAPIPVEDAPAFVADHEVAAQMRALLETTRRPLVQANYHNPLARAVLLDGQ